MLLRIVWLSLFILLPLRSSAAPWHEDLGRNIKVGIFCASQEGASALAREMEMVYDRTFCAQREYCHGQLWNITSVITMGRQGKVAAASTATHLIETERVDIIISLGTAGSLREDGYLGDVLIGETCMQWDLDGRPFTRAYQVPLLGEGEFPSDPVLLKLLKQSMSRLDWSHPPLESSDYHNGLIITGDQFLQNSSRRNAVSESFPSARGVDMECAAIAQVCFEHDCPFIPIRIIANHCNSASVADLLQVQQEKIPFYWPLILQSFYQELESFVDGACSMDLLDSPAESDEESCDEENAESEDDEAFDA